MRNRTDANSQNNNNKAGHVVIRTFTSSVEAHARRKQQPYHPGEVMVHELMLMLQAMEAGRLISCHPNMVILKPKSWVWV